MELGSRYGNLENFEMEMKTKIKEAGFYTIKYQFGGDWLGASPDGFVFDGDIASRVPVPLGKHIRVPGDEAKAGEVILHAGQKISPAAAGLAASSSIDQITVHQIPQVDILVTGDELISSGLASPGQIRDSLSLQIPSWINHAGGQVGQQHAGGDHRRPAAAISARSPGDAGSR